MISFFKMLTVVLHSGDDWTPPIAKQNFEYSPICFYFADDDGET